MNAQAALCSPRLKFSMRCSEVRSENARMLIVVVLSVQFGNTLASQTYRFGTSCVWPKRFVTNFFGSFPMRRCRSHAGCIPGSPALPPEPSRYLRPPPAELRAQISLRMLPHLQHIFVPLEMHSRHWNAVWVLHLRIEIHEVRIRAQSGRLNSEAYRCRIAPFDLALERRAESVEIGREYQGNSVQPPSG